MDRREFLKDLGLLCASLSASPAILSTGCKRSNAIFRGNKMYDRVIVLGVDGIDPHLTD